jgi:hypothetical protein
VRLSSGLWVNSFDGTDDYVDCGTNSSLNFTTGNFAVMGWVKPSSLPGDVMIVTRGASNVDGWRVFSVNSGRLYLELNYDGVHHEHTYSGTGVIPVGAFTFFTCVREAGVGVRLYTNGTLLSSNSEGNDNPITSTKNLLVGTNTGLGSHWPGIIALLHIINRAPSATQIAGIFRRERHLFNI